MKTRTLVLVGLGFFLLFVILGAPIATLYPRLANPASTTQPVGLSGTVFNGAASAVNVNGRPMLRQVAWTFRPISPLMARLGFHVTGNADGLSFDGNVAKLIGGALSIDSMRAAGPLKNLLGLTGNGLFPIEGQAGLKLDQLKLVDNFPKAVSGSLEINALKWSLAKEPLLLGDFTATIVTEAGVIIAKVAPLSGPLDVGGEIRLLADRNYEVDLKVKAKPNAEPLVQNFVRSLGQSDTEGFFRIKTRGQL